MNASDYAGKNGTINDLSCGIVPGTYVYISSARMVAGKLICSVETEYSCWDTPAESIDLDDEE